MMYNEKIKNDFLNSLSDKYDIDRCRTIFERIYELENQLGKDLYDISYDQAFERLSDISNYTSVDTIRVLYREIKHYKLWALSKGYISDDEKPFIVDKTAVKNFHKNHQYVEIFRSPGDLIECLSPLLDSNSKSYVIKPEIIVAYLLICYQGFYPKEVLELTLDNIIVTKSNILLFNDRYACIVYKEFEEVIRKIYTIRDVLVSTKFKKTTENMGNNLISFSESYSFEHNKKSMRERMWKLLSDKCDIVIKPELLTIMGIIYITKSKGLLDNISNDSKYGYDVKQLLNACYGTTEVKVFTKNNTMKIYETW